MASFIKKSAFGLDVSDYSIEAVKLKKTMGKIKLESYARVELEPKIVEDGIIYKKDALIKAIRKLLQNAQPKPIKNKYVILSLPESRVFTHIFRLPAGLDKEQIKEAIQYQAEEVIPLSLGQVDYTYQIITTDKKYQEVFYAACDKKIISDYQEVLEKSGLVPYIFEFESAALARSLVRGNPFEGALIADIGARTTIISIFDHNGIRWSINIPMAGNKFAQLISRKLKIPVEIAEDLKRANGLDPQIEKGKILEILKPAFEEILAEIKKSINYYEKKIKYNITNIVLCGGSAQMPQIKEYFKSKLKREVEIGDPLDGIDYDEKIFKAKNSVIYATVMGLALRTIEKKPEEAGINLIDKETMIMVSKKLPSPKIEKPAKKTSSGKNRRLIVLLIIFFLLIVTFFGFYFWQKTKIPNVVSYTSTAQKTAIQKDIPLEFSISVNTKATENLEKGVIAGRILEKTLEKSKTFKTSGVKSIPANATGQATIINDQSADQPLVATTRLLSKEGILYRLKEGTNLPAHGQVKVNIYADQAGQEYEIGPTDFTIPGLAESMQKYIYAKSDQPTTGGISEVKILTQEDIDKAKSELENEISQEVLSTLASELKTDEALLPDFLSSETIELTPSEKVEAETEEFSLKVKRKIQALAFSKNDLLNEANQKLTEKIPSNKKIEEYKLSEPTYSLNKYEAEKNTASLNIKMTVSLK